MVAGKQDGMPRGSLFNYLVFVFLVLALVGIGLIAVPVVKCRACWGYVSMNDKLANCPWCRGRGKIPLFKSWRAESLDGRSWCPVGSEGTDGKYKGHWKPANLG